MTTDTRNLKLLLEGRLVDRLGVVSFRGTEEDNRLFEIDIDFTTDATDERLEERLLDSAVTLSILDGAEVARTFHGIAGAVEAHGLYLHDRRAYRLRLVPRMWRLKQRRTRRVWTDVSSLDVAATLFREHHVVHRTRVAEAPPKRPYCVQYDESDLAFLTRLLAEEGLFYTFDHPRAAGGNHLVTAMGDTEVVVIGDVAVFYPLLDGGEHLRFERIQPQSAMTARDDHVTQFAPRATLRSSAVRAHGHDLRRPTTALRDEALHDPRAARADALEAAHEPRTLTVFEGSYEDNLPVPLPGLPARTVPRSAARRLDAVRRKARVIDGASFCRRLSPGKKVVLHDHDLRDFDGGYVITRVEHEGYGAEVVPQGRALYQNRFACVPDSVPLRMPQPRRRPRAVTETALVVGPPGQETHTDDLGRIRLRFFWDIAGRPDAQATAWARVAQSWAGAGWGAQFIPRPGMEVVVTYLDGDPDRPLVTGCVYNATHAPPFPLPQGAAQSGFRSQSTPGGQGANELRFDDRRGEELVLLQAQRDMQIVAGGARTTQIASDESRRVGGHCKDEIGGNLGSTIAGSEQRAVLGASRSTVAGSASRAVDGSDTVRVDGGRSVSVGGDLIEHVDGSRFASTGEPGDVPFVHSSHVFGDHITSATGALRLKADAGLVIECGESRIEITKDGIRISGAKLSFAGAESTTLKGKGPSLRLGEDVELAADKMRFFAKDAWLTLDKDVRMKGDLVKMNCDDEKPSDGLEETASKKKKPLKIKLSDASFTAYGERKYQLLVEGDIYEGTTTGEGLVDKEIPEDARSLQLAVWLGDYPTGEKRTWVLASVPMPPPTDVRGAQLRLQNLGYRTAEATGVLDAETEKSIASFQSDAGLPVTGKLDGATAAKLGEVHGQ
jgi:type VI secretion system secreted protein VgrG